MIYVKLIAVCETGGCETTEEYLVELSSFETDEGLEVNDLPQDWEWAFDVFEGGGVRRSAVCPHCVKERKK